MECKKQWDGVPPTFQNELGSLLGCPGERNELHETG